MADVFTLTLNTQQATRAFARLRRQAPYAIARALNRSGASGKTIMVREISRDIGVKVSDVRDTMSISQAHTGRLQVDLVSTGKRIPLIDFKAKGPYPSRGKGRGVSYKIGRQRRTLPHAFIATVGSGRHRGVFMRTGTARTPIRQLYGPSLPHVFRKFMPLGLARMKEQLIKNLQHEFRFAALKQNAS